MKCNARSLLTLATLGILTLGAIRAAQQQDVSKSTDDDNIIRTDVTRVNMLFTVTDKRGRFVTDLTRGDFTIFENKKQQNIREFTAESDLPLRLAILIDTSNSIRDRFHFQQEAAGNFINQVMRDQDKAVVVSFDTAAELAALLETLRTNTVTMDVAK